MKILAIKERKFFQKISEICFFILHSNYNSIFDAIVAKILFSPSVILQSVFLVKANIFSGTKRSYLFLEIYFENQCLENFSLSLLTFFPLLNEIFCSKNWKFSSKLYQPGNKDEKNWIYLFHFFPLKGTMMCSVNWENLKVIKFKYCL